MRIFAHYDENGEYLAFYNDDLYKESDTPHPYIEITEDEWQQALSYRCKVENGKHVYVPFTEQEELDGKYASLRSKRDELLSKSDWTQMPDSPLDAAKKAEWAAYRQELRDLPNTVDINNPVFPTMP